MTATTPMTAEEAWLCLSLVPGVGVGTFWRLLRHFESPLDVLSASAVALECVGGLRAEQRQALASAARLLPEARRELQRLTAMGGTVLCPNDQRYPDLLRQIADLPPVLFALGNVELLSNCCVAVVGSRSATGYGRRVAHLFGKDLAAHGATVVSGMALGIDGEAHQGALLAGGGTVGVLGCGVDVVYPRQNRRLFQEVRQHGLLISEYPLGSQPEAYRFPARNRIIAGLSQAVVVVEAARKSGSLITAQLGLDYNREIFAVPGQVDSYKSTGAHWLLQQGAKLALTAEDILQEIGALPVAASPPCEGRVSLPAGLDAAGQAVWRLLEPYPQNRDALLERSGLLAARLSEILLYLELEGLLECLPGDMIRRLQ